MSGSLILTSLPTVSIAATSASKAERQSGTTSYTFTATRTGDTSTAQTANWSVTGSGTNVAAAADFVGAVLPTGTVSFGIGETSKTITVNVLGDTSLESDEGFTVTLNNTSTGLVIGTAAASGTIINDDASLTPTDGVAGDDFGSSVSLSADGRTAIVGAPGDDVGANANQGSARVFSWTGTSWIQRGEALTPSDGFADFATGDAVALSANGLTAAVGVSEDDLGANFDAEGSVRVFDWTGSAWVQRGGPITPTDAARYDNWGSSLSLSENGNTVLLASRNDGTGRVFDWTGTSWIQRGGALIPIDGAPLSGIYGSVSLSADGNTSILGSSWDDVGANSRQGSARVFDWTGAAWAQRGGPLTPLDGWAYDFFGHSVSLSANGQTAIVGGDGDDIGRKKDVGSARVFDWTGSDWLQRGEPLCPLDGEASDGFGVSVNLSADGMTAIIGGPYDYVDSGQWRGSARVFDWISGAWVERGGALTPAKVYGIGGFSGFGWSVDLSADGNIAIVGGRSDVACVFVWNGTAWREGGPAPLATSLSLAATSASKAEGNSGSVPFTFTATRTGDTSTAQTANWSVTGSGSNAAAAADFVGGVLPSGTVSFGIGETSKTITVQVAGDTSGETDEGFTVTLSNASAGLVLGTSTATGTIINDDASVSIAATSASKAEGQSGTNSYTFTATRTGDTSAAQTADWSVTGSGSNAAAAADFVGGVLPTGTVSFGIGVTSQTITVNVLGETSVEADEGFTITLRTPSSGLLIGTATASGTIQNDDSTTPASPSVSGVVYHWKSHALLSGVTVSAENSSSGSSSTALQFRDVRTDANGNVLVDLLGNGASGVGNFGADLSLGTGITASFQSSLPGDWTVLQNSGAGSLSLAGFGLTSVSGSTKLGTLTFAKSGAATPFSVSLQSGEYGTLTAIPLSLGYRTDVTDSDGVFQMDVGAGTYTVDASRGVSDVGRAVSSADALAALKLAVSLNPNSDPDGTGPLQPARVSPYQFLAADVNNSGTITSVDALSILKMAVRLADAPTAEWLLLREQDTFWNAGSSSYSVTRSAVPNAELPVSLQIGGAVTQNLVGVLTGDVNGSWRPLDANGNALAEGAYPALPNSYFVALSSTMGAPLDLWGL